MSQGQTGGIRNSEREATGRNGDSQPRGGMNTVKQKSAESGIIEL